MNTHSPFHLAIPVSNLETCRTFYRDVLECKEGRSSNHWVDFNFFGHQLVLHYQENKQKTPEKSFRSSEFSGETYYVM